MILVQMRQDQQIKRDSRWGSKPVDGAIKLPVTFLAFSGKTFPARIAAAVIDKAEAFFIAAQLSGVERAVPNPVKTEMPGSLRFFYRPDAKVHGENIPALLAAHGGKLKFSHQGTPEFTYQWNPKEGLQEGLLSLTERILDDMQRFLQG